MKTYGSQCNRTKPSFTNSSDTSSSPSRAEITTVQRKRPFAQLFSNSKDALGTAPVKKLKSSNLNKDVLEGKESSKGVKKSALTQLHFDIGTTTLRTCSLCDLSYTKGAPGDESLHRTHCARVQRGVEWGIEEQRELERIDSIAHIVDERVKLRDGETGNIICIKANATGKVGHKLVTYLKTANLALSAPDMTREAMSASKVYLFLLDVPSSARNKIVGCVVAQQITTAMAIAESRDPEQTDNEKENEHSSSNDRRSSGAESICTDNLIHVEGNLYCHPEPLPTPLGIPRLFVSAAHRRKGIAQLLLNAAARTFYHGCVLDQNKGQIAFSQPTSMGRAVMEKWGGGKVRVYEE